MTEFTMSHTPVTERDPVLPADVVAYAEVRGLKQSLIPHLEMTKRIFQSAQRITVVLEEDPEIANVMYIVFWVKVSGLEVSQAVKAHHGWVRESLRCCPPPIDSPFILRMDLSEDRPTLLSRTS